MMSVGAIAQSVYAASSMLPLVTQFFSCPAAQKLLDSDQIIKPLFIRSTQYNSPYCDIAYDAEWNPRMSTIGIPEWHLKTKRVAISDLMYELLNANASYSRLLKLAAKGEVELDLFAREYEQIEQAATRGRFQLNQECSKGWDLPALSIEADCPDQEIHQFNQEIWCHTDAIRRQWIDKFQKIYCEKNPKDERSCKTKRDELCDYQLPESFGAGALAKRVCKLFPSAHEKVRIDPEYRKIIASHCPEKLLTSRTK